jgi:hypothetical protein
MVVDSTCPHRSRPFRPHIYKERLPTSTPVTCSTNCRNDPDELFGRHFQPFCSNFTCYWCLADVHQAVALEAPRGMHCQKLEGSGA